MYSVTEERKLNMEGLKMKKKSDTCNSRNSFNDAIVQIKSAVECMIMILSANLLEIMNKEGF